MHTEESEERLDESVKSNDSGVKQPVVEEKVVTNESQLAQDKIVSGNNTEEGTKRRMLTMKYDDKKMRKETFDL